MLKCFLKKRFRKKGIRIIDDIYKNTIKNLENEKVLSEKQKQDIKNIISEQFWINREVTDLKYIGVLISMILGVAGALSFLSSIKMNNNNVINLGNTPLDNLTFYLIDYIGISFYWGVTILTIVLLVYIAFKENEACNLVKIEELSNIKCKDIVGRFKNILREENDGKLNNNNKK